VTRAQLLDAAKALLGEMGFARATTADIARRAGVTTGALHHHFPTKESLFFAVLDDATEATVACFRDLEDADDALVFEQLVRALWRLYGSPAYWAVWEININYRCDPALHEQIARHRRITLERVAGAIAANRKLRPATRRLVQELHPFIMSAMRGMCLDAVVFPDEARQDDHLAILAALLRQEAGRIARPTARRVQRA